LIEGDSVFLIQVEAKIIFNFIHVVEKVILAVYGRQVKDMIRDCFFRLAL